MSIEDAIAAIHAKGLLVNNLFQTDAMTGYEKKKLWQANIRSAPPDASFFEFGRGVTPQEALQEALKKTNGESVKAYSNGMPSFLKKAHVSIKTPPPKKPTLDDL